jgi:hypothetical protein
MSQNMNIINLVGTITDPLATTQGDGQNVPEVVGKRAEQITNELNGRYHVANYRNHLFTATASGITIPVVTSGLVNTFALVNPANSGKYLDLVDVDISTVLATTVVDTVGIYALALPVLATATLGTIKSCIATGGAPSLAQFYTAVTNTGQTPVLQSIIGGYGAVTDGALSGIHKEFDGKVLVPPGVQVCVAMSTAASTASGMAVGLTWMEYPI